MAKTGKTAAKGRPKRGARVDPAKEGTVEAAATSDAPIAESRAPGATDLADRWVVLIYMAVTSPELRGIMEGDLAEMATQLRLLGPDDLRVYALMDTADGGYAVRHRVHQTPTAEPDLAIVRPDPTLADKIGRKAAYLSKLIQWRFAQAPAGEFETGVSRFGKTLLVLWGHSQGVAAALSMPGSPTYAMVGNGGFGFSEFSGDSLSLPQIRRAIAAGLYGDQHIDILSFDSCFMSAAEVSAEFQSAPPPFTRRDGNKEAEELARVKARELGDDPARVDFVVASQSAVLLDGLDYGRLVDVFVKAPTPGSVTPEQLGRSLLEQASSTSDSPVSLSLLYTGYPGKGVRSPYDAFSEALRALVTELSLILDTGSEPPTPDTPPERQRLSPEIASKIASKKGRTSLRAGANRSEWLRVRASFESATWHRVRQFIDVGDLCRRLVNNCRTPSLRQAALAVLRTLQLSELGGDQPFDGRSLVVDVRSLSPLLLSGMSLYCPWLFPTPAEVRKGAWNAVVDLYDYATDLWFNRGSGSWGAFIYHAKHVLEESRQRAINTELTDVRALSGWGGWGNDAHATPPTSGAQFRDKEGQDRFLSFRAKEGQDRFLSSEPVAAVAIHAAGAASLAFALDQPRSRVADRAAAQGPIDQVPICPKRV